MAVFDLIKLDIFLAARNDRVLNDVVETNVKCLEIRELSGDDLNLFPFDHVNEFVNENDISAIF